MMLGVVAAITLMPGGVCKKGWMVFIGVLFLSPIALFGLLLVRIVTHSRMKRSTDGRFFDGRLRKRDPLRTEHV